jgi:hypothetical protein
VRVPGHAFPLESIRLFLRLVLGGVSLRAARRVMEIVAEAWGNSWKLPHWTTGRLWLLRLGHFQLKRLKEQASDWAWLIDHSVQIGSQKCLAIVGLRLSQMPARGECLRHEDLRLIALDPMASSTRKDVQDRLEAAVKVTGVPRVIVDDHGVDLTGGVQRFQQQHPQTVEIYDLKHKAACLLKARLERDPQWQRFQTLIGQTRCAIQQTELAFLAPPGPKPKARFMNLQPMLDWAAHILEVLREPPEVVLARTSVERLREKLGWLEAFREVLPQWREWQQVVNGAVGHVGRHGIYEGVADDLKQALPPALEYASSRCLAEEIVKFVTSESEKVLPGERFPGSTEALESLFGRFKVLEKQHAKGGFTSLILGFGALVSPTTAATIGQALTHSHTQAVWDWCRHQLGPTLLSQRKQAFRAVHCATKLG